MGFELKVIYLKVWPIKVAMILSHGAFPENLSKIMPNYLSYFPNRQKMHDVKNITHLAEVANIV